ncbi:MAG: EF-hand domain-containing protein [Pseudomonadota bacterium]
MNLLRLGLMLAALVALDATAQTGTVPPGPALPPALRNPSPQPPASGLALRNEAMQKLKQRFEQADLDASGSLTRDEAERAGLGFVVARFDQIDSAGRGKVNFADVKRYMQQRKK